MSEFTIESGIPFTSKSTAKYPLNHMGLGDSFLCHQTQIQAARAAVSQYSKSQKGSGKKFVTRRIDDENFRVWRVE